MATAQRPSGATVNKLQGTNGKGQGVGTGKMQDSIRTAGGNPSKPGMRGGPPKGTATQSKQKQLNNIKTSGGAARGGSGRSTKTTNLRASGQGM
jgi:hypothetical protein